MAREIVTVQTDGADKFKAEIWSQRVGLLSVLVMIGAGIYLLMSESASAQFTVFDALMHGIGAYFIARGLWVLSTMLHRHPS